MQPDNGAWAVADFLTEQVRARHADALQSPWEHHSRGAAELRRRGLVQRRVQGDGNCAFRVMADLALGDPDRHQEVREAIVDRVAHECWDRYSFASAQERDEWVETMRQMGHWEGEHFDVRPAFCAAADYGRAVHVIVPSGDRDNFEPLLPHGGVKVKTPIVVLWNGSDHFDSAAAVPSRELVASALAGNPEWLDLLLSHGVSWSVQAGAFILPENSPLSRLAATAKDDDQLLSPDTAARRDVPSYRALRTVVQSSLGCTLV